MHPLQSQLDDLRKYHDALGTKLASLERHLDPEHEDDIYDAVANKRADEVLQAPTMERQPPAKEWEIVEFFSTDLNRVHCTLNKKTGGYYSDAVESEFTLSHMLGEIKSKEVTIHAVRRLHDDSIWRVGDSVTNETDGTGKITSFNLFDKDTMVVSSDCFMLNRSITMLNRPQPLFVTADGVPLYDGDKAWYVDFTHGIITQSLIERCSTPLKHFSTVAAAQAAYDKWLFEQPVLTLNDVNNIKTIEELKQVVKEKLGKK